MKTTVDYGEGITLELDLGDTDRSFREAAAAFKAKHGCASCNHANSAHGPSGCTVAQDKLGGGKGKCGCSALMKRRAA